ncbi:MAG: arylsulfatase [Bryobacterales bacterium]|nr:arylsulfatase [Bryobacterales bacterium]
MHRRHFVMGAAAAALARPAAAQATRKPNVLFLMTDQQRGDCVGASGNRVLHTPHLDRLANEGVRFSCAYSTTPTCTPARASLLTGLGPWRHGLLGYSRVGRKYPVEMPSAMAEAGYYTTGIGKMHWHPQRNARGFHRLLLDESSRQESPEFRSDYRAWFWSKAPMLDPDVTGISFNDHRAREYALPEELHPTRWTADAAVSFLEQYQRSEPFFLKVSFARPHSPYDPPGRWMKRYEDAALPAASIGRWAEKYRPRSDDRPELWHGDLGAAQVRHSRQGYYGSVSFIDEQIGRILEMLERRGWMEETLILFTSDHGDMTGDHHLWRKSYAYEASAHIPMLMRLPKGLHDAARGTVRPEPVEIRDILPTFLDAAGSSRGEGMDGRSMLSLLRRPADWRKWIDLEHDVTYAESNHWSAMTDGKWKYIFHAPDGQEQLFHLSEDPGEVHDLASSTGHEAELRTWRSRLVEHLAPRGEAWVKGGRLALRPKSMKHSPLYPGV